MLRRVENQPLIVRRVKKSERRRNPAAPFTTSSLQQEAARKLGFRAYKTMSVAQQLYEGLDIPGEGTVGLITYMRTDSTRIAASAQEEARSFIQAEFGSDYVPEKPRQYTKNEDAQDAHEGIRPTSVLRHPEKLKDHLSRDQYRLYKLIWERFIASQMASAILDTTTVDSEINGAWFRATGSVVRFPGFMAVYIEGNDDAEGDENSKLLPPVEEGNALAVADVRPEQHFTQPPPRYSESSLVKAMEELGIGRPSTYAPTIDTILKRGYVVLEQKRFLPTELGEIVVNLLKENFNQLIDVDFTANMEQELDAVEDGEANWVELIDHFYHDFQKIWMKRNPRSNMSSSRTRSPMCLARSAGG
ncbi:hypothetical protein GCM10025858_34920 [Alicyclobacillus sacchari]|nr:hypothetical protein GCM10025858_34920 [Alicyclobacillus sacchari]